MSHDFHFVFKAGHHRVLWQTLLQLTDVCVIFHDLWVDLIYVQLLKFALRRQGHSQNQKMWSYLMLGAEQMHLTFLHPFCEESHSWTDSQSSCLSLSSTFTSSRMPNVVTSNFIHHKAKSNQNYGHNSCKSVYFNNCEGQESKIDFLLNYPFRVQFLCRTPVPASASRSMLLNHDLQLRHTQLYAYLCIAASLCESCRS